jgi:hypothetical protein
MTRIYLDDSDSIQDHVHTITERELDMIILKMGSLLSILQNKKTNQAKMLILLVKNESFRKAFLYIAELNCFQKLVNCLMEKYPTLCESKVVYGALKRDNKRRKKLI